MKRLNEMTREELANLADEDMNALLSIECAFEGVRQLPPKPTQEETVIPERDKVMYSISKLSFLDKKAVEEILEIVEKYTVVSDEYSNKVGYDYKYAKPVKKDNKYDYPHIIETEIYSKSRFMELHTDIKLKNEDKKAKEADLHLYEEIHKERETIYCDISNAVYMAKRYFENIKQYSNNFKHYLEIAKGDFDIAKGFFEKAYKAKVEDNFLDYDDKSLADILKEIYDDGHKNYKAGIDNADSNGDNI